MKRRDLLAAAAGAAAALALGGGIATAAIPESGGAIDGCYQNVEGQLRVIDPQTDMCRPSELPLRWSEEGQPGEQGSPGAPGKDGADGRDGRDGRDGSGVTVAPEPPGANCSSGGVRITAANGSAFLCNSGPPPDPGEDQ
jgi:hypothetical protein